MFKWLKGLFKLKMSERQFIRLLTTMNQTKLGFYSWCLIGGQVRYRAISGIVYCPIEILAQTLYKDKCESFHHRVQKARQYLNLDYIVYLNIIAAADESIPLTKEIEKLRAKILDACHLVEKKEEIKNAN